MTGHLFFPAIGNLFCVQGRVMVASGTDDSTDSAQSKKKKKKALGWSPRGSRRLPRATEAVVSTQRGESELGGAPQVTGKLQINLRLGKMWNGEQRGCPPTQVRADPGCTALGASWGLERRRQRGDGQGGVDSHRPGPSQSGTRSAGRAPGARPAPPPGAALAASDEKSQVGMPGSGQRIGT